MEDKHINLLAQIDKHPPIEEIATHGNQLEQKI
jgi:hypothetical protein